jgi:hypothetical protein
VSHIETVRDLIDALLDMGDLTAPLRIEESGLSGLFSPGYFIVGVVNGTPGVTIVLDRG